MKYRKIITSLLLVASVGIVTVSNPFDVKATKEEEAGVREEKEASTEHPAGGGYLIQ